jgi:hypothetical protein
MLLNEEEHKAPPRGGSPPSTFRVRHRGQNGVVLAQPRVKAVVVAGPKRYVARGEAAGGSDGGPEKR